MSSRARLITFLAVLAGCVGATAAAVVAAVSAGDSGPEGTSEALAAAPAGQVLFRADGQGQLAVGPLGSAARAATLPLRCDRVYMAAGNGLCLARGNGFAAGYEAKLFGEDLRVRHALEVAGVPSRARVSPDGRYGSVTLFVSGHSYAAEGAFSTETTLIDMRSGERVAELEDFSVSNGSRQVTAVDMNFWGVTFQRDSDRFYATLATGGRTYLIEGSVSARRARVLHENVECPSLSPDGTRVAYKRATGDSAKPWRLSVLDLATMDETLLAETESVDDQVEWLDDGHVLYARAGATWTLPADGGGAPERVLEGADSPSVLRG